MTDQKINHTLEIMPERDRAAITWTMAPPATYSVSLSDLERMISVYGSVRAELLPAVIAQWAPGQMVTAHREPSWSIERDQLAGDPLLHIRHVGFGWLHFIINRDDARKLGQSLIAFADAPPPDAAGSA